VKHWIFKRFRDEDGAVTVDWVVLTAAVVALAGAATASLNSATSNVATSISEAIGGTDVETGL
jgi:Flp pilus assembly pilin Flp